MAFVTTVPFQHVVAVVCGTERGGNQCFRVYDNDGAERREGAGKIVTVGSMATWDGKMHAVVEKGACFEERLSPLIVPPVTGPGATLETSMVLESDSEGEGEVGSAGADEASG